MLNEMVIYTSRGVTDCACLVSWAEKTQVKIAGKDPMGKRPKDLLPPPAPQNTLA